MENLTASLIRSFTPQSMIEVMVRLMIIFMIVPIHEYAHAWSATKLGDETPSYQGRLTLNPIAHIDPIGALALLLCGFGWGKPVQINPLRFKQYRKGSAICAAAGPISNLIFGFVGMIFYKVFLWISVVNGSQTFVYVSVFFSFFTSINLGLAMFNLIPIPPLDGSKIVSYFAGRKFDAFMYRNQTIISIAFMVFLISPVLQTPLTWIENKVFWVMDKLTFFVDLIMKAIIS